MEKIDIRSLVIGFLTCLCLFLMMGQYRGNMGDITVNSITVEDNGDGGFIQTYNSEGKKTTYLGTATTNHGILQTYDLNGDLVSYLAVVEGGAGGALMTYNRAGKSTLFAGTGYEGFGYLRSYDNYGTETAYIGTSASGGGVVEIKDKYGNIEFQK